MPSLWDIQPKTTQTDKKLGETCTKVLWQLYLEHPDEEQPHPTFTWDLAEHWTYFMCLVPILIDYWPHPVLLLWRWIFLVPFHHFDLAHLMRHTQTCWAPQNQHDAFKYNANNQHWGLKVVWEGTCTLQATSWWPHPTVKAILFLSSVNCCTPTPPTLIAMQPSQISQGPSSHGQCVVINTGERNCSCLRCSTCRSWNDKHMRIWGRLRCCACQRMLLSQKEKMLPCFPHSTKTVIGLAGFEKLLATWCEARLGCDFQHSAPQVWWFYFR